MSSPPEYFLTVTGTDMENGSERRWHEYFCGIEHQSMLKGVGEGGTVAPTVGITTVLRWRQASTLAALSFQTNPAIVTNKKRSEMPPSV